MASEDNSWDDVYAALGIEAPKPAAEPAPAPPAPEPETLDAEAAFEEEPVGGWSDEVPPLSVDVETEDMIVQPTDGDEGDESAEGDAGEGQGEPGSEGQGEPERKRRRRRRRRRKGGPGEDAAEGTPAGEAARAEGYEDDEPEAVAIHSHNGPIVEDAPADTLRDLIATWNVPAWDEIISGLYRPER